MRLVATCGRPCFHNRALMCGLVLTALAHGMIAGTVSLVIGVHAPGLLGTLTGVLLLAWGTLLVHPRAVLMTNGARVPFLSIMLDAFGGLVTNGLVRVMMRLAWALMKGSQT